MKKVVTVVISVVLALVVLVTAGVNVVYYLLSGMNTQECSAHQKRSKSP